MQTLTEQVYRLSPPGGLFDRTVVVNLFPELSAGARDQIVHRALREHEIERLVDGRYCLVPPYRRDHPHPFTVAAFILYPSYISFESALAYHGLIPEAVHEVASACAQRSRTYDTPLGRFSYRRIPRRYPMAGVIAVAVSEETSTLVATPLRAIADLVYLRKDVSWKQDGVSFLTDSMRIERDDLKDLTLDALESICMSVRSRRSRTYLQGLAKELTG